MRKLSRNLLQTKTIFRYLLVSKKKSYKNNTRKLPVKKSKIGEKHLRKINDRVKPAKSKGKKNCRNKDNEMFRFLLLKRFSTSCTKRRNRSMRSLHSGVQQKLSSS